MTIRRADRARLARLELQSRIRQAMSAAVIHEDHGRWEDASRCYALAAFLSDVLADDGRFLMGVVCSGDSGE